MPLSAPDTLRKIFELQQIVLSNIKLIGFERNLLDFRQFILKPENDYISSDNFQTSASRFLIKQNKKTLVELKGLEDHLNLGSKIEDSATYIDQLISTINSFYKNLVLLINSFEWCIGEIHEQYKFLKSTDYAESCQEAIAKLMIYRAAGMLSKNRFISFLELTKPKFIELLKLEEAGQSSDTLIKFQEFFKDILDVATELAPEVFCSEIIIIETSSPRSTA